MQLREGAAIALDALRVNKLRSALTMLGNIVGVTSVIAVVSLISGMDERVRSLIAEEGADIVTLSRRNELEALSSFDVHLETLRNPRITLSDYQHVAAWVPSQHIVAASMNGAATVTHKREKMAGVAIEGWTANVGRVRRIDIDEGRLFTGLEVDRSQPVCVIGADVVVELFGNESPLGNYVRIGGRHTRVIGTLVEEEGFLGQSPNSRILVPISFFQKVVGSRPSLQVPIRLASEVETEGVISAVTAAMRVQHRLRPDEADDFAVTTSEMLLDIWGNVAAMTYGVLVGIVSVSLVVGGIVIMNTMLVSVTERTREVGLRKALGARRRDITWQFLLEAVVLSVLGGAIGTALGFAIAKAVATWSPLPYAMELWSVFLGVGVTAGVGIIFGIYPANRAASLSPVEALRVE